ncbi:MAG: hypothetical protein HDQ95_09335 [Roseburia sp.]|nr:hypothetical protein [Roseburia sp.]
MEEVVLCGASAYSKKFYLNEDFMGLPDSIKDELKIMCVLFTEDVGGIFQLVFDEDGNLGFRTSADEGDLLYDEIGCGLKIKELQQTKQDLMRSLQMFYQVFYIGLDEDEL